MVVLDASVILKWFYPAEDEPHTDVALEFRDRLRDGRLTIVVPSYALYECASSMRESQYDLSPAAVRGHVRDLWRVGFTVSSVTRRLLLAALDMSFMYKVRVYDAYYFAAAQFRGCPCVTADHKAFRQVRRHLAWVHFLGHVSDVAAYDD